MNTRRSMVPILVAVLVFVFLSVPSVRAQPSERTSEVPEPPSASPQMPETVDLEAVLRGEGRGLTADEAAARAVETAPGMDRARAGVRAAGANVDRAMWNFIPQLALSFRYTRLSETDNAGLVGEGANVIDWDEMNTLAGAVTDPAAQQLHYVHLGFERGLSDFSFPTVLNQYAFRASLTYPLSAVLLSVLPAYEAAQEGVRAAEHSTDAQMEDVAYNAREAFYNYARARAGLAVAQSALRQAEARHRQVQAFVQAGTAARVDELRMRAQVATASVAVARATGGVRVAATAVRTLLHLPTEAAIAVGEDVLRPLPPLPESPEALLARALEERNEVRALRAALRASERQIVAAEGSRWPTIAVQGNFDVANPNQRVFPQTEQFRESWDVSAVVSWSPHDLLNGEAQASEARARRDQTDADLRALEDGIRIQVIEAATAYESAREALEAARLGVEAANESYRVQAERFRAGASTVSDVIDATAEQVRAQLELVNTAIDARLAMARLARATASGAPE